MFQRANLEKPEDFFTELGRRPDRGVYFVRLGGYNSQLHAFLRRCYDAAKRGGTVVEGKLPNPDRNSLDYYNAIIGPGFQLDRDFIAAGLEKWLPRVPAARRQDLCQGITDALLDLRKAGKTDNILKNAYIKFMCWLYYRFGPMLSRLGTESPPKVLCEGGVGLYELHMLRLLGQAGCDILLLQTQGAEEYSRLDPDSAFSQEYRVEGMGPFPEGFSLAQFRQEIRNELEEERFFGPPPRLKSNTNAWAGANIFDALRLAPASRGNEDGVFYNCFARLSGVEDPQNYENELYRLHSDLKAAGRRNYIQSGPIPPPSPEEIAAVKRSPVQEIRELAAGLAQNIQFPAAPELQSLARRVFAQLLLEDSRDSGGKPNRAMNRGVSLICWLRRCSSRLFQNWKMPEVACFLRLGGCQNDLEALFCRFLVRLPVDVVLLVPDLEQKCCLTDPGLLEISFTASLRLDNYPSEDRPRRAATSAYRAERELDSLMYQDSGLYRDRQFQKASALCLQTMCEEIPILWDQELQFRPGFSTEGGTVSMPVIFSKVSGVKDGNLEAYWLEIKKLLTPEARLIDRIPEITAGGDNPLKAHATGFLRDGRLLRAKIKSHRAYAYGFLRETMQEHLLDKLQQLLDQRIIRGTFENGAEYTVTATALNLDKETLRQVQQFDFTKKNPKLVYVIAGETALSLEDSIRAAFLNLVGFDIVFFVPTGYRCVEQFFTNPLIEEHQAGDYLYDLRIPDFARISAPRPSWRERLFKRGS